MDINDNFKKSKNKKYSKKVVAASEEYLQKYELTSNQLSDDQKNIVFDFIKFRRTGWLLASLMTLISIMVIITGIFYIRLVSRLNDEFPEKEIVTTTTQKSAETDHQTAGMERHAVFMLGMLGGSMFYSAAACVFQIVFFFTKVRRKHKVLKAFLPSVKIATAN